MFDSDKQSGQLLPFAWTACETCLYKQVNRCSGPVDYKSYFMEDPSVVPCINTERRQQLCDDLYMRMPPIPNDSNQDHIALPPFIPCITDGMPEVPDFAPNALFAVSLKTLIKNKGDLICNSIEALRKRLKLPSDAKLALIGTAKDWKIERLWTISDKYEIWQRLAEFGFEFATSLTYSIFDEHPRANQIYNQDRNFITHDFLANLGVPTIPFLYPYDDEDYKHMFEWLSNRPDINKVAVLAQFYRFNKFRQFFTNMIKIQDGVKRPLEFLVVGITKPEQINSIMTRFNATIVSSQPFYKALFGCHILDDLSFSKENGALPYRFSRSELALNNIEQYSRFCRDVKNRSSYC